MSSGYFVYLTSNKSKSVLYTGVTKNLMLRLQQHAEDALGGKQSFAGKYNCVHLLYFEEYPHIVDAIAREKEIKGWSRRKKNELIKGLNPTMDFLNDI